MSTKTDLLFQVMSFFFKGIPSLGESLYLWNRPRPGACPGLQSCALRAPQCETWQKICQVEAGRNNKIVMFFVLSYVYIYMCIYIYVYICIYIYV